MVAGDDEGVSRSEDTKDATEPGHALVIGAMVGNGSGANVCPYLIEGPIVNGEPCVDDAAMVGVVKLKRGGLGASRGFVGAMPHAIQNATRAAGGGFSFTCMRAAMERVGKARHEGPDWAALEVACAIACCVTWPFAARGDVVEQIAAGSADDLEWDVVVRGLALGEFAGMSSICWR